MDTGTKELGITGIWSRLSSGYYYNSSFVTSADNLWAFRVVWPIKDSWVLGVNYLADGLGDETGISMDVLGNFKGRNVAAEIGTFKTSSTFYPEYRVPKRVLGFVIKADVINTQDYYIGFSCGHLGQGFAPYYSSVASRSGGSWIPFDENTHGIEVTYDHRFSPSTKTKMKASYLKFIDKDVAYSGRSNITGEAEDNSQVNELIKPKSIQTDMQQATPLIMQSEITPVLLGSISIIHELKVNTFLEAKCDYWQMETGKGYGRFTTGITMNF